MKSYLVIIFLSVGWLKLVTSAQNQYATFYYRKEKREVIQSPLFQTGTSYLRKPSELQNPLWKELYALGRSQHGLGSLSEQLEPLVQAQVANPEADLIFLRKVVHIITPAMKPFELQYRSIPGDTKEVLHITKIESSAKDDFGPYRVNVAQGQGVMHTDMEDLTDTSCKISIRTSGVIWYLTHEKGMMFKKESPLFYKHIKSGKCNHNDVYATISTLVHEMCHVACSDRLALDPQIMRGISQEQWPSVIYPTEEQADFISMLLLQNEKYFLGRIRYDIIKFLSDTTEQATFQAHKYDPKNTESVQTFKWLFDRIESKSRWWLRYPLQEDTPENLVQGLKNSEKQETHPATFLRINSTLQAFAAYLIQVKHMEHTIAIDFLYANCSDLIEGLDLIDQRIKNLVYDVIKDWKKANGVSS